MTPTSENLSDLTTKTMGTASVYVARWGKGWEWATIMIDENTGTLAITSTFGNWSFTWGKHSLGCPTLHEFLSGTGPDYVASKCIDSKRRREFSFDATKHDLIEDLLNDRREGRIEKAEAREKYDALKAWDEDSDGDPSLWTWPDWLEDCWYEIVREVPTSEDRTFREVIHPIVVKVAKENIPPLGWKVSL